MSVDITSLSIRVESIGIKEASNQLSGLSTSAGNAEKRIMALSAATQKLQSISMASATAMNSYMQKLQQQSVLMQGLSTHSAGAAASTASLATAMALLAASMNNLNQRTQQADRSQRQHNEAMKEAHSLARGLSGAFGALWLTYGNLMGMSVGVAIGASLRGIIETGKEVEKQLNFVYALSDERKAVNLDDFLRVTDSSVQSVTDAANAMRALAQNGLSVTDSLSALPTILNLATVGEMNVGQAAIAATGAVGAFGLSIGEVERVADIFAKTAATSNTSVLAITESMKQASTVASLFGVSIEQTAAMLGLLAKINITGGAAGTSFTNMLTGLYEPTEQAKKAMDRLGVSAFNSAGKMKDMTILLEDIKRASSSLSDQEKTDILGAMVTTRGLKSLVLATENLGDLKKKTEEAKNALGFMKGVVEKLEDDSAHAFTRLGVIIQTEFVRSFMNAAPEVQKLGQALGDLFKGDGVERMNTMTGKMEVQTSSLANMFKNLVVVANFFVEHIGVISSLVAGYTLWRMAIGYTIVAQTALGASTMTVGGLYTAWRGAVIAASAAQALATTSMAALTTANLTGAATQVMVTTAVEANTAATVANATAQRAMMAFILPALGVLAVAVAAGAGLWLLFRDNTDDATDANTKMSNSIHVIKDQLDKEIERLERSLELWDERAKKFSDPTTVTPEKVDAAKAILGKLEQQIEKASGLSGKQLNQNPDLIYGVADANLALASAYTEAKDNLKLLNDMQDKSVKVIADKSIESTLQNFTKLRSEVEKYKKAASEVGSRGSDDFLITNPAERNLRNSAQGILDMMDKISLNKNMGKEQIEAANTALSKYSVDFQKLQEQVSLTKKPKTEEVSKASENDALQSALKNIQNQTKVAKIQAEDARKDAQSEYKRGMIGEIDLIERTRVAEVNKQATFAEIAAAKIKKLQGVANQETAIATARGEMEAAMEATNAANKTAISARAELEVTTGKKALQFEVEKFKAQGEFRKAYDAEFKKDNAINLDRLEANIAAETNVVKRGEFEKLKAFMKAAQAAGEVKADNLDAVNSFNVAAEATRNSLKGIQTATEGQGLAAMFEAATAASEAYAGSLPDLKEKMSLITDPKAINEAQAELTRLAETQRKMWAGVAESISSSLSNAFGQAGKAAGDLMQVIMKAGQTQQMLSDQKRDSIEKATSAGRAFGFSEYDIAKRNGQINLEFAAKERSARVKAYGDAAGAAKSFFKEGSTGYKVLETAEKAFRLIELAGMIKSLVMTQGVAAAKALAWAPAVMMSFMASMGPWGMAAAGVAIAAVLGGAFGGGGGGGAAPMSAADRQKQAGTGSVLGDSDAKSESIANSLEIMEKNSGLGLVHSGSMVKSLNVIAASLGNLSNLVVRTAGIKDGVVNGVTEGTKRTALGNPILGGPLAMVLDKIPVFSALLTKLFGATTSIKDQGIKIGSNSLAGIDSVGVTAQSYADIETKKKALGITYSTKNSTKYGDLPQDVSDQFTLVIKSLADSVTAAASTLGLGGDAFTAKLKTFVVNISEISLKGMSADEIQKQFETVFSKLGDDMAKFAIDGLVDFSKIGEGTFETLARLANQLIQVKDVFAILGKQFDATGMDAVKISDDLVTSAGGLEKLTEGTKYFVENFLSEADRMKPIAESVTARLKELGMSELTSIELYTAKIKTLNLTNAAEQDLYTDLLALGPAFKESADYATKLAEGTVELTKAQQKALDIVNKQRELDIRLMEAQGNSLGALGARRNEELAALEKISPALAATQRALYGVEDAAANISKRNSLDARILEATGDAAGTLARKRLDEVEAMKKTNPEMVSYLFAIYGIEDATKASTAALTAEKEAKEKLSKFNSVRDSLDIRMAEAVGNSAQAAALKRKAELDAMKEANPSLAAYLEKVQAAEAANVKATDNAEKLTDAKDALNDAYERESSALQSVIDKFKSFSDSLKEFKRGLLGGDLSTLSPEQKYLQSKANFAATAAQAAGGDESAMGQLQSMSQDFLDASRGYYASTEAYANDFNAVQNALDKTINMADQQVSAAQAQLAVMNAQASSLVQIKDGVLSFADALKAYTKASDEAALTPLVDKKDVADVPTGDSNYIGWYEANFLPAAKAAATKKDNEEVTKLTKELLVVMQLISESSSASVAQRGAIAEDQNRKMQELVKEIETLSRRIAAGIK